MRPLWSLVLGAALAGCGAHGPADSGSASSRHVHAAPHGGALQVLGDEAAHVELAFDPPTGRLTAYVLDGEAERAVRVKHDLLRIALRTPDGRDVAAELLPVASALTGETAADTSKFECVVAELRGASAFEGVLETITARGARFDAVRVAWPHGNESAEPTDAAK